MTDRHNLIRRIREALADCYPDRDQARLLAQDVGLNPATINFDGTAVVFWQSIVDESDRSGKLAALIQRAYDLAPARRELARLKEEHLGLDAVVHPRDESMPPEPPFQLPVDPPKFTGREAELDRLGAALSSEHSGPVLCLIWGMGGVGKTALAIHAAHQLHRTGLIPDGILWVDLGQYTVEKAAQRCLRDLGVNSDSQTGNVEDLLVRYRDAIGRKRILLGLDNAQSDDQVRQLLPNRATARVIVTSRKRRWTLTDFTDNVIQLSPFPLADSLALLKKYAGVRVDAEPVAAASICEQAGNLPLAIAIVGERLADASRWPSLGPFAARLRDKGRQLAEFAVGDSEERNLEAVLGLSYDMLSADERRLFDHLALFKGGGFGTSGVAATLGISKEVAIDELDKLADWSLVQPNPEGGFKLHDLVHRFAEKRLHEEVTPEDLEQAAARLTEFTLAMGRLRDQVDQASRWLHSGAYSEAAMAYQVALELNEQVGSRSIQARIYGGLATVSTQKRDFDNAIELYRMAQDLNQATGNRVGLGNVLGGLASIYRHKRDAKQAIRYYEDARRINEEVGNVYGLARALGGLGSTYAQMRDFEKAETYYKEALSVNRQIHNPYGESNSLGGLGSVCLQRQDYAGAVSYFVEARALHEAAGNQGGIAVTCASLGLAYRGLELYDDAIQCSKRAIAIQEMQGDHQKLAQTLAALGWSQVGARDFSGAIDSYRKALAIQESTRDDYRRGQTLGGLAVALGHAAKWQESQDTLEKAIALQRANDPHGLVRTLRSMLQVYHTAGRREAVLMLAQQVRELLEGDELRDMERAIIDVIASMDGPSAPL